LKILNGVPEPQCFLAYRDGGYDLANRSAHDLLFKFYGTVFVEPHLLRALPELDSALALRVAQAAFWLGGGCQDLSGALEILRLRVPAALQLRGHQPMARIHLVVLLEGASGFILQLLALPPQDRGVLVAGLQRSKGRRPGVSVERVRGPRRAPQVSAARRTLICEAVARRSRTVDVSRYLGVSRATVSHHVHPRGSDECYLTIQQRPPRVPKP
jgi:hypothetical protein